MLQMKLLLLFLSLLLVIGVSCAAQDSLNFKQVKGKIYCYSKGSNDSLIFINIVDGQYHYVSRFVGDERDNLKLSLRDYLFDDCCQEITVGTKNLYFIRKGRRGRKCYIGISTMIGNVCLRLKEHEILDILEYLNFNKP